MRDSGTCVADRDGAGAETTRRLLEQCPALRRFAAHLAHRRVEVDDLVQETLFLAYRARGRFRPGTDMGAWTGTILRREFLTQVRQRRLRRTICRTDASSDDDSPGAEPADRRAAAEPGTTFEAVADDLDDDLLGALAELPPLFRDPFCRIALGGWSHAEVARLLGIPTGTVMSRVHRARQRLRASLERRRSGDAHHRAARAAAVPSSSVGRASRLPTGGPRPHAL